MTCPSIYIFMLLSFISQCCSLQLRTFHQVWDPPALSTVALEDEIPPGSPKCFGEVREDFVLNRIEVFDP